MIETRYCGLELKSPVIVGASRLTSDIDSIKKAEKAGAGAVVVSSLFEEQIQLQHYRHDEDMVQYDDWHAEMTDIFPDLEFSGAEEHLVWVRKAKEALDIPVIASLNAVNRPTWVSWAQKLAEAGADALELNFYSLPTNPDLTASQIEDEQVEIVREVVKTISVPVSVKLSPHYTNPLNVIKRMDKAGVEGVVLFNRFFQPDIDPVKLQNEYRYNLSTGNEYQLPLRFAGLLSGEIGASICASGGIEKADTVKKEILAGADAVQIVTGIYRNSMDLIGEINDELKRWMRSKGFESIKDFRGSLDARNNKDPKIYKRSQYVRLLLNPWEYIVRP
ncbi:dihydroorotate dehydrogenase-like protein [Marispirochaeta sp.]|jgi:dihydroorotate dehydrogenase (fumarate)|uniref:dihydroorotate dehydrogenase-like protein n=1 Tax=Marispirochaeta sp. TaxID=2038653 RepID=UPI0029C92965|nr:dihydroorotate dehydrogenase-like protein [Marispirochaeta sp.]